MPHSLRAVNFYMSSQVLYKPGSVYVVIYLGLDLHLSSSDQPGNPNETDHLSFPI